MRQPLKCRRIPKLKIPEKSEVLKVGSRESFEPMTDECWFEWSGEPIKIKLSPDTKVTRVSVAMPVVTPIMIYAKEVYDIPYKEYELSTLVRAARFDLGIDDKTKLISKVGRLKNFKVFEKERFNTDDPWGDQMAGIFKKGSSAYDYLKLYSQTSYGSIIVNRINKYKGKFTVYSITEGDKKFHAMGANHHIRLPKEFPMIKVYPFTGQKIDPLAVIHHEFEHTVFGKSDYEVGSLREEVAAVKGYENPVRILNGYEPRYSYYQRATNTTASIFDYKKTVTGGKTTDPLDPRLFK